VKGFVSTPDAVVDLMVDKLFHGSPPAPDSTILDPGCGRGAFIAGILRWCCARNLAVPTIIGIESDPKHVAVAAERFAGVSQVQIRHSDFLTPSPERYEYVIGNPPYVPITGLSEMERALYRRNFSVAKGRFDLYLLFFEQALGQLRPGGRLVFITPEKFLYVDTARHLRELLGEFYVEQLHFLTEETFGDLVTYPLVTLVTKAASVDRTTVITRDGDVSSVRLNGQSSSWLPLLLGAEENHATLTLRDVCLRISCGVATGADSVFVVRTDELGRDLAPFARPTIAGRLLTRDGAMDDSQRLLMPYDTNGRLMPEAQLGALGRYLNEPSRRARLLARTCVVRKAWYAFHETPPLPDLLKPKLLCKDITASPFFVPDTVGAIVPRHSVYYIVPSDSSQLADLADYLNSGPARDWLRANSQRAANGFLRLQSHTLKRLPIPVEFASSCSATRVPPRRSRARSA
jgi:hypothetical protein